MLRPKTSRAFARSPRRGLFRGQVWSHSTLDPNPSPHPPEAASLCRIRERHGPFRCGLVSARPAQHEAELSSSSPQGRFLVVRSNVNRGFKGLNICPPTRSSCADLQLLIQETGSLTGRPLVSSGLPPFSGQPPLANHVKSCPIRPPAGREQRCGLRRSPNPNLYLTSRCHADGGSNLKAAVTQPSSRSAPPPPLFPQPACSFVLDAFLEQPTQPRISSIVEGLRARRHSSSRSISDRLITLPLLVACGSCSV